MKSKKHKASSRRHTIGVCVGDVQKAKEKLLHCIEHNEAILKKKKTDKCPKEMQGVLGKVFEEVTNYRRRIMSLSDVNEGQDEINGVSSLKQRVNRNRESETGKYEVMENARNNVEEGSTMPEKMNEEKVNGDQEQEKEDDKGTNKIIILVDQLTQVCEKMTHVEKMKI